MFLFAVLSFIVILFFYAYIHAQRSHILYKAKLVGREKSILCLGPIPLRGRPDEIYQARTSELVVVDYKNREQDRVFQSDITQLSTYATILRNSDFFNTKKVHPYGFVILPSEKKIKVKLLNDNQIEKKYNRALQIYDKKQPKKASNKSYCKKCNYRNECSKI